MMDFARFDGGRLCRPNFDHGEKEMKNLKELVESIKGAESEIAYGSESDWWGRFLENLRSVYRGYYDIGIDNLDGSEEVNDDFANWWTSLYDALLEIDALDIDDYDSDRLCEVASDGDSWMYEAKKIIAIHQEAVDDY